ncbi:MAG: Unknown protein [uncultured Sulfurovum sp.]|uniref:Uncharacterized protein n=1 Tax=uncultured Sulfurovum sp. TaxID=269237 RepID=A0A6S6S0S9_9BACT|nr:MAG: Unknown protein [uncultured Sulfurovum sp.]
MKKNKLVNIPTEKLNTDTYESQIISKSMDFNFNNWEEPKNGFQIFGEDENVSLILLKDESDILEEVFLHLKEENRSFEVVKKFEVENNDNYFIIAICKNIAIYNSIKEKSLSRVKAEILTKRQEQASTAGLTFYTVQIDNEYTIIAYDETV